MRIEFFAEGEPKGQPRARAFAFRPKGGGKPIVRMYDPASAEGWKSAIAVAARRFLPTAPLEGPVRMDLDFVMARPKGHYGTGRNAGTLKSGAPAWHTGKPDRDNLDKAVMDALTVLGMWRDDAQVVDGRVSKRYGERPGVLVTITLLSDQEPPLELPDPVARREKPASIDDHLAESVAGVGA